MSLRTDARSGKGDEARWAKRPALASFSARVSADLPNIKADAKIPYEKIPHFLRSTVETHAGQLICGQLSGQDIVAMEGRSTPTKGIRIKQLTFPVRVMKASGARFSSFSNACGGMNPQYAKGELMIIDDHINLMKDNPLIGIMTIAFGLVFPICRGLTTPELIDVDSTNCLGREDRAVTKVFTSPYRGRTWKRGRNIASCGRSVPTWSACPRFQK